MQKNCVFCGQRPDNKTKEHVIPRWLIEATGDPKRMVSFGTHKLTPEDSSPKRFAFDQLSFPACASCNSRFSKLEDKAKSVMESLLGKKSLRMCDLDVLLDWLDKVRTGMWLGLIMLEQNPWGIKPKFHIANRIGLRDRSVGICLIEGRSPGLNLIGPESPCFGLSPTTMCLLVNDIGLFSSSTIGLCSRRLGFPFPTNPISMEGGNLEYDIEPGLERVLRPVEPIGPLHSQPFIYQPIFATELKSHAAEAFNTAYVADNSFDFSNGKADLFIQRSETLLKYSEAPSMAWVPKQPLSLRETYLFGRRWAYKKLERHYAEQTDGTDPFRGGWGTIHKRLLSFYEREMAGA